MRQCLILWVQSDTAKKKNNFFSESLFFASRASRADMLVCDYRGEPIAYYALYAVGDHSGCERKANTRKVEVFDK